MQNQSETCRKRTLQNNKIYLKNLLHFFGDIPLSEFHIGHFEHYQQDRIKKVGPQCVNHELNTLSRLLKMAGLWGNLRDRYKPVPLMEPKLPRIFTADELLRIKKAVKTNPLLEMVDIVFTITKNTTASGTELRYLRMRHVELEADPPRVHIPLEGTKNKFRPRTIPLNDEALAAFKRAAERAKKLGSHYPESYLFPLCVSVRGNHWDPNRPASGSWLQRQVRYLRAVTGIPHINPHVFRHQAVTELLESGAPEQTVIELAGWVNRRMVTTYSHTRIESKADAINLLGKPKPKESVKTTTKPPVSAPAEPVQTDGIQAMIDAAVQKQVAQFLQGLFGGMVQQQTGKIEG